MLSQTSLLARHLLPRVQQLLQGEVPQLNEAVHSAAEAAYVEQGTRSITIICNASHLGVRQPKRPRVTATDADGVLSGLEPAGE